MTMNEEGFKKDDKVYISMPLINIVLPRFLFEQLNAGGMNIDIGSKLILGGVILGEIISIGLTEDNQIELLLIASNVGSYMSIKGTRIGGLNLNTNLYCVFTEIISKAVSTAISIGRSFLIVHVDNIHEVENKHIPRFTLDCYMGRSKDYIESYVLPNLHFAKVVADYSREQVLTEVVDKYENNMDDFIFNECLRIQKEVANMYKALMEKYNLQQFNDEEFYKTVDDIYEFEEMDDIDFDDF